MADPPFRINEAYLADDKKKLTFNEYPKQPDGQVRPAEMARDPPRRIIGLGPIELTTVVLLGIVVQLIVGLGGYSGRGRAPMHGDFEAQRHWMEITHHLPVKEWYRNGTRNNLQYWGLDYPPLTAYHSKAMGWIAHRINPAWVALNDSHGHESPEHKLFMRLTAVFSHLLTFTPGVVLFLMSRKPYSIHPVHEAILIVLFPGLLSVDHGHFQYNSVSLGFFLISVHFLIARRTVPASVFFVLALNYKQMELYHALPIFVYILAVSLSLFYNTIEKTIVVDLLLSAAKLWKVGFTTTVSFLVMWTPLAYYGDENSALDALKRVFPFERGLFEDKVASVWCAFNPLFRFTDFHPAVMMKLSLAAVALSSLPCLIILFLAPTSRYLRAALCIVALNFFLFSYQVHEKSILLAAVPALLLIQEMPMAIFSFLVTACCSLFSLCIKDDNQQHAVLFVAYFLYLCTLLPRNQTRQTRALFVARSLVSFALNAAELFAPAPARLPHLFPYLTALYSCCCFLYDVAYLNYDMISTYFINAPKDKPE